MSGRLKRYASLRRIRRLDFGIVSRLSFESLTFFGALAVLIGATFNVGLLAEFGLSFISVLAVDDLVMTSFALLVFLVPFYGLSLALISQLYLVRNIGGVLARRGDNPRLRRARMTALAIAFFALCLVCGLFAVFIVYRHAEIGLFRLLALIVLLGTSVIILAYIGTSDGRSRIWLVGLQLATLCAASVFFGATVAGVRQSRSSEVVLETTSLTGGIILISKAGVFLRTPPVAGIRKSVFIPTASVKRIND